MGILLRFLEGLFPSKFVTTEKETWKCDHAVYLNRKSIKSQQDLESFGKANQKLGLCYVTETEPISHQHWFVSNLDSTNIEFGDSEIQDATGHKKQVLFKKNDRKSADVKKVKDFIYTDDVKKRMGEVLGVTNFSMVLRNSEHVARYI